MSEDLQLGEIIEAGRECHRDAIHIAVAPVVAADRLSPGWPVTLKASGFAYLATDDAVGIVDPFLTRAVESGERFWLWLTPGTVTGMRHHWAHPAFPEPVASAQVQAKPAGQQPKQPAWRTPTVLGIVAQMRQSNDFTGAPVLADALEEADFDDGEMLAALRKQPGEKDYYEQEQYKESVRRALDFIEDDGTAEFSEKWLRRYAQRQNSYDTWELAFNRLIDGLKSDELYFHGSDLHGLYELDDADELKRHAERYLGIRVEWRKFTFSCSC